MSKKQKRSIITYASLTRSLDICFQLHFTFHEELNSSRSPFVQESKVQKNTVAQELRKGQMAKESNMHKNKLKGAHSAWEAKMQNNQIRAGNEFVQELEIQGFILHPNRKRKRINVHNNSLSWRFAQKFVWDVIRSMLIAIIMLGIPSNNQIMNPARVLQVFWAKCKCSPLECHTAIITLGRSINPQNNYETRK